MSAPEETGGLVVPVVACVDGEVSGSAAATSGAGPPPSVAGTVAGCGLRPTRQGSRTQPSRDSRVEGLLLGRRFSTADRKGGDTANRHQGGDQKRSKEEGDAFSQMNSACSIGPAPRAGDADETPRPQLPREAIGGSQVEQARRESRVERREAAKPRSRRAEGATSVEGFPVKPPPSSAFGLGHLPQKGRNGARSCAFCFSPYFSPSWGSTARRAGRGA